MQFSHWATGGAVVYFFAKKHAVEISMSSIFSTESFSTGRATALNGSYCYCQNKSIKSQEETNESLVSDRFCGSIAGGFSKTSTLGPTNTTLRNK